MLLTAGCENLQSVSSSVSYDYDDKIIAAAITLNFKDLPSSTTVALIQDAGGSALSEKVWLLPPRKDYRDSKRLEAVKAAIREKATVKPYTAPSVSTSVTPTSTN